jgi:chromosome segregation ATPase
MIRAIFRLFLSFKWCFTGKVTKVTEHIEDNPRTQRALYDDVISAKLKQLNQYKEAVSSLMTLKSTKQESLKKLRADVHQLEKAQEESIASARDIITSEGPEAKYTHEYQEQQTIYQDQKATLIDKKDRQETLSADLESLSTSISEHKPNIRKSIRELEQVQAEKCQYIADILAIKEEQETLDKMSGISKGASQKLEELQDRLKNRQNYLKLSRELEGKPIVSECIDAEFELLTGA